MDGDEDAALRIAESRRDLIVSSCNKQGALFLLTKEGEVFWIYPERRDHRGLSWIDDQHFLVASKDRFEVYQCNREAQTFAKVREKVYDRVVDLHDVQVVGDEIITAVTSLNAAAVYDLNSLVRKELISYGPKTEDLCHLNSAHRYNGDLYVSMFSPTAEGRPWPERTGAVFKNRELLFEVRQPHSLAFHGDTMYYCRSADFAFVYGDTRVQVPAYARGVAFSEDGKYAYVGMSTYRNPGTKTEDYPQDGCGVATIDIEAGIGLEVTWVPGVQQVYDILLF